MECKFSSGILAKRTQDGIKIVRPNEDRTIEIPDEDIRSISGMSSEIFIAEAKTSDLENIEKLISDIKLVD